MRYQKPALSLEQQVDLLIERGLVVADRERALRWLTRVSYYRFSAYLLAFKVAGVDQFRPGSTFESVRNLYNFDRKLRLMLLDAIERIEVGVRTAVTYHVAQDIGPFGHTARSTFNVHFDHERFMDELEGAQAANSRETFVMHYRTKYTSERHLPIWMASELLSFGCVSKMVQGLRPQTQRRVADVYGVPVALFSSWIHMLSVLRNVCAHHSRLWNRTLGVKPKLPPAATAYWPYVGVPAHKVLAALLIADLLLSKSAPASSWRVRLADLIKNAPEEYASGLGLSAGWQQTEPWSAAAA